jgi:hypothetical protein
MDPLRNEMIFQLRRGHAHAPFEKIVKAFPFEKQGIRPKGLPYSGWQLLEHIRLALEDIVEFCDNEDGHYKEKEWPEGYWPKLAGPPSKTAWNASVRKIEAVREKFIKMLSNDKVDLFAPFSWGDGQTLFHEACLIVDHTAYHLGEIVTLRRLLGVWSSS